ncbi:MAG: cbb3-type cytochrome c oxidase subunit 3 [Gammaproteobacteria bacterium]|nr:MAG: cbb3-type cytochrome c oxidase subunit 3 [Gammaproteobacteria bacterium]
MDITLNDIRAWHTVAMLVTFLGIVWWAYSKHRRPAFDEAANLPFADERLDRQSIAELEAEDAQKKEKLS